MRSYECAVILYPSVSDDGLKTSTAKYVDIIARSGGEITRVETWGKRRLSFEIKEPEGHYCLLQETAFSPRLDARDLPAGAGDNINVLGRACLQAVIADGRIQDHGTLVTPHGYLPVDMRPNGSGVAGRRVGEVSA